MQYCVEHYLIDTTRFRISCDGSEVPAEPKVFDLLVYLIEHRDRVVTRDELLQEIWEGREVSDTTLSNHIKSIRRILGDDGDRQQVIQTVRGRGYRFIATVSEGTAPAADLPPPAAMAAETAPARPRYRGMAVVLLISAVLVATVFWQAGEEPAAVSELAPYILVVPFDVSGGDRDSWQPFADQVTREVIRNLRKISGIRVVPPPSAFSFSNDKTRAAIRSRMPDVRYVLDGAISISAGNQVRITAELEDLDTSALVWDDDYQSSIDDTNFFSVQSDISKAVSVSLQVVILDEEQQALGELPTEDLQAYEQYVAGRQQMSLFNQQSLHSAIEHFNQAIVMDRQFVSAYVARADAYRMLMTYFEPPVNMLPEVIDSVSSALEIDPDSAEALSSLGMAYVLAWRWQDAWRMLNEARLRDDSLALTELGFALYYSGLGDREGVLRSLERANQLDPLNIELADWGQWSLTMVGELDAARAWGDEKIRLHPDVGIVYTGASIPASIAGDHQSAIELGLEGLEKDPHSVIAMITLAQVYGYAGMPEKVQSLLDQAQAAGDYMCPYETAVAYLSTGQRDQVFPLLDEAVANKSNCMIFLRHDPRMKPMHDDPRYQLMLTRVGLDDTAVATYQR